MKNNSGNEDRKKSDSRPFRAGGDKGGRFEGAGGRFGGDKAGKKPFAGGKSLKDFGMGRRGAADRSGKTESAESREENARIRADRAVIPDEIREESGQTDRLEGKNPILEAYRAGRCVDKLFVQESFHDSGIQTILREAKKTDTIIRFVTKERLDAMSQTGHHQGVIAQVAAFRYAEVDDILKKAEDKGEAPFVILLDGIEDPHNLGAIIRTACLAGAHGVIIPKNRASGLTAVAARASAGAVNYVPVARCTNLGTEIERLKEKGLWFVCADMDGKRMYDLDLKGPIGLVIGSEGEGVSRLVREKCDFTAAIPMKGEIDSLNASVAAGVLMYEIVRQRGL